MKDKGTLPYVEAAILEMHRLASIGKYWSIYCNYFYITTNCSMMTPP